MNKRDIKFYIPDGNLFRVLTDDDKLEIILSENSRKQNINYFHTFKGFDTDVDGLLEFKEKFNKDADELLKHKIDYRKYYSHNDAVELTFKRYTTNVFKTISIDEIKLYEYNFIEKCYNAGIMYFDTNYKDKQTDTYGYDYSSFYPHILNHKDLQIPITRGKLTKVLFLDYDNLKYGVYKVNIKCNDPNFNKVFLKINITLTIHYNLPINIKIYLMWN
jgi:hypothetical protein